jgi:hypothetical protein
MRSYFALLLLLSLAVREASADDCAAFREARALATELTRIDRDAAVLAAIAQGTPVASRFVFERVRRELSALERALPAGRRELVVPTTGTSAFVLLDAGAVARARSGEWTEWNCLVAALQARVEIDRYDVGAWLRTTAVFNPYRVQAAFEALPGVRGVSLVNYYGLGDVVTTAGCGNRISYYVRLGDGDCQSGCLWEDFYWFASEPPRRLRVVDVAPAELPRPPWVRRVSDFVWTSPQECGLPDAR